MRSPGDAAPGDADRMSRRGEYVGAALVWLVFGRGRRRRVAGAWTGSSHLDIESVVGAGAARPASSAC